MGESEKAESKVFRLSKRQSVEFTVGADRVLVEWDPYPPKLTRKELKRYRLARSEMLARLAVLRGIDPNAILTIEV